MSKVSIIDYNSKISPSNNTYSKIYWHFEVQVLSYPIHYIHRNLLSAGCAQHRIRILPSSYGFQVSLLFGSRRDGTAMF